MSAPPPAMAVTLASVRSAPRYTHLAVASPAVGGSRPRRNCSHSVMSGTGILGGAVSGQHGRCIAAPAPLLSGQPFYDQLTSATGWTRAALGAPTAALATATVLEGERGPSQGPCTHAVVSTLGPARLSPLRGALCGSGPGIREKLKARTTRLRPGACTWQAALESAQEDPRPHQPGSREAGSLGPRAQAPRADDTRSGRSLVG